MLDEVTHINHHQAVIVVALVVAAGAAAGCAVGTLDPAPLLHVTFGMYCAGLGCIAGVSYAAIHRRVVRCMSAVTAYVGGETASITKARGGQLPRASE
jgi:hypothetical protein